MPAEAARVTTAAEADRAATPAEAARVGTLTEAAAGRPSFEGMLSPSVGRQRYAESPSVGR